jgi:hypothetical protein
MHDLSLYKNFRMSDSCGSLVKIALHLQFSSGCHAAAMMDVSDIFIVCLVATNVLLSLGPRDGHGSHVSRQ